MVNSRKIFIKIALTLAEHSKCVGANVGAIIVKDGRIISSGYNGTPSGYQNCNEVWDENATSSPGHYEWSKTYEIHAEQNALSWAAKKGISVEGSDIYVTLRPCNTCTKLIIASGIKNIYYNSDYSRERHLNDTIESYLNSNNVNIKQIDV